MSDDVKDTKEETVEDSTEAQAEANEAVVEENNEEESTPVEPQEELEVEEVEQEEEHPDFRAGDTVKVFYKIIEAGKERIQPFEGIVISKRGGGASQTFTVRRIGAQNIGVERIFPLLSPNIAKIEVLKRGKVRRAKLYYLRDKKGRAATRVKELKSTN